jgi:signal transduction histidine kinase
MAASALARAAERLSNQLAADIADDDLERAFVDDALARLCRAIAAPDGSLEAVDLDAYHAQLFVDGLRGQLLEEWNSGPEPPDAADMLTLLSRLERVRREREPEADTLSTYLSFPRGLELVVEIAHDLRSPLTSILFLSETLLRGQTGPVSDVQQRQLGIIYSAALGLISLASDVIELARGGDQLIEKERSAFSIDEVFEAIRDVVLPMAEEKELELRTLVPEQNEWLGYPVALSRVLLNLTTNALKFTERGHVELSARSTGPDRLEFSVRDTGDGIPPVVLDQLYRPFRRTHDRPGYSVSGSGLGLAICRKLVDAMGSELRFESRPDWGTRFFFELTLPPSETSA